MGWKEVEDMKQKVSDYIADRLAQEERQNLMSMW